MSKKRVSENILHPIKEKVVLDTKPETTEEKKKEVGEPEKQIEPPLKVLNKLIRVVPFSSFIIILDHETICLQDGKCFCTIVNGKRLPKTIHIIAGCSQVVPAVVMNTKQMQDLRRAGKVIIKRL